jgi:hypothetical protein
MSLWSVHEAIVTEMKIRGMNHHSPILPPDVDEDLFFNPELWPEPKLLDYPQEAVDADRWHLLLRWEGQFCGRVNTDPIAWDLLELKYRMQGSVCLHDGEREKTTKHGETVWICLLCKHPVKEWNE